MRIRKLESGSAAKGPLAAGCEYCTKGSKMVLFVTGRCSTGCFYCPVSDERKGRDSVYANEMLVSCTDEIIEEAVSMDAEGTGITGGDPLIDMDRTVRMIKLLKGRFGMEHHIHLYTSTIDPERIRALAEAGLDEIRFHPRPEIWGSLPKDRIREITSIVPLTVGIEVPALPDYEKELKAMAKDSYSLGIDFINLNELEFSEGNWDMMSSRGYGLKDDVSSAIKGSEELARRIMKASSVPIHFCSSSFKDSVQLRRRLVRRAEHVAEDYDLVTEDGTILRGVIQTEDLAEATRILKEDYEVPDHLMFIDPERKRIETASWILEEICSELPFKCFIIEEYPTADRLEIERIPLN